MRNTVFLNTMMALDKSAIHCEFSGYLAGDRMTFDLVRRENKYDNESLWEIENFSANFSDGDSRNIGYMVNAIVMIALMRYELTSVGNRAQIVPTIYTRHATVERVEDDEIGSRYAMEYGTKGTTISASQAEISDMQWKLRHHYDDMVHFTPALVMNGDSIKNPAYTLAAFPTEEEN